MKYLVEVSLGSGHITVEVYSDKMFNNATKENELLELAITAITEELEYAKLAEYREL